MLEMNFATEWEACRQQALIRLYAAKSGKTNSEPRGLMIRLLDSMSGCHLYSREDGYTGREVPIGLADNVALLSLFFWFRRSPMRYLWEASFPTENGLFRAKTNTPVSKLYLDEELYLECPTKHSFQLFVGWLLKDYFPEVYTLYKACKSRSKDLEMIEEMSSMAVFPRWVENGSEEVL